MTRKALTKLPATPDLTATERAALIESLRTREVTAKEDPPLVTTLARAIRRRPASACRSLGRSARHHRLLRSRRLGPLRAGIRNDRGGHRHQRDTPKRRHPGKRPQDPAGRRRQCQGPRRTRKTHRRCPNIACGKTDIDGPMQALMARKPACIAAHTALRQACAGILTKLPPSLSQPDANRLLRAARKAGPLFLTSTSTRRRDNSPTGGTTNRFL